jgi:hypothetical protein
MVEQVREDDHGLLAETPVEITFEDKSARFDPKKGPFSLPS